MREPIVEAMVECIEVLDATAEASVPLEATAEIPVAIAEEQPAVPVNPSKDDSAMADPHSAHSPMSPDDRVSDEHVGLPMEQHTTGGTTPLS